jgi:hypothetical protein
MLFIKDIIEQAAIKLGGMMKIRPPKEEVRTLKSEFGYMGYSYKYPKSDYDITKYRTYDYAEATIDKALYSAITTGILITFTTMLQNIADEGNTHADFDFFKNDLDEKLKKYNDLHDSYKQGIINVIKKVEEISKTKA